MSVTPGAAAGAGRSDRPPAWRTGLDDAGALARAPLEASARAWVAAGAVGVTTAALVAALDDDVDRVRRRSPRPAAWRPVHALADLAGWYGHDAARPVITAATLTGTLYAVARARGDDRLAITAGRVAEAVVFEAIASTAVKLATGRARPETGEGPHRWRGPGRHGRAWRSFPSGHTATAVAIATVISRRHRSRLARAALWTFAAAAAAERVDRGRHWASDVVAGAALGWAVGRFVAGRRTGRAGAALRGTGMVLVVTF